MFITVKGMKRVDIVKDILHIEFADPYQGSSPELEQLRLKACQREPQELQIVSLIQLSAAYW
jgi:hypothetical protein